MRVSSNPRRSTVAINGLRLVCWTWGEAGNPPILMLHGWADTGATFAFIAAHLAAQFQVLAPDFRGFGESEWARSGYWFPDYLADVDALSRHFWGTQGCHLVGHSMGGNIAGLYAGIRPAQVNRLVLLEGFGLPPTAPPQALVRYRRWLNEGAKFSGLRDFASHDALMKHLTRLAPKASSEVLAEVAPCWARPLPSGEWRLKMDPLHKRVYPILYRRDEARACWCETTAPTLLVSARDSNFATRFPGLDVVDDLAQCYRNFAHREISDAGHMLHWEQPAQVAAVINEFLSGDPR